MARPAPHTPALAANRTTSSVKRPSATLAHLQQGRSEPGCCSRGLSSHRDSSYSDPAGLRSLAARCAPLTPLRPPAAGRQPGSSSRLAQRPAAARRNSPLGVLLGAVLLAKHFQQLGHRQHAVCGGQAGRAVWLVALPDMVTEHAQPVVSSNQRARLSARNYQATSPRSS